MDTRNEWEQFFDGHAPVYEQNVFTKHTAAEVEFLLEELRLPPGARILDVGCGTGRHAIALARHGYRVTGVDLSEGMLAVARAAAADAGVEVEWIHADATQYAPDHEFDAAICLCEGAFVLFGMEEDPDEHDMRILRNIYQALKPSGRLVMTTLNGLQKIRQATQAQVENGTFDPLTIAEVLTMEWDTPDGKRTVRAKERGYMPGELVRLLREVGFRVDHLWGGTAGNWGRRPLDLDEIEIMVVATRCA